MPAIVSRQDLFTQAPFPSCHAATLAETRGGQVVAAFFGGTREGHTDVSVWFSRLRDGRWSEPELVGDGLQADGTRFACWNPVLFQPAEGPLILFFKVGPSPSKWWGMRRESEDGGRTWSDPARIPPGMLGPAKNKPVQLPGGDILCPCSVESEAGWRVYFERSTDGGRTFSPSAYLDQAGIAKATQPSILIHPGGVLQAVGRTTAMRIFETWSKDHGATWSPLSLTDLPNPNSGIDAVSMRDGRHVLAYNHSNVEKVRYPLNIAVSDDGKRWEAAEVLEDEPPGQYSYPAVIQSSNGLIHVAYTYKRRTIRHATIDPSKLVLRPLAEWACPPPGSPTHRADEFQ